MANYKFDYRKLRGRIVEKFGTVGNFASALGVTPETMSLRFSGKRSWKQSDIIKAMELLDIPPVEIDAYFFTLVVQDIEQPE